MSCNDIHEGFDSLLMQSLIRVSSRNFTLGGKLTDHVAVGHGVVRGGAGEGCAPSRAERERKFYFFFGGFYFFWKTHCWLILY